LSTSIESNSKILLQIENIKNEHTKNRDKKIEDEKKKEIVVRKLQDLDPQKLLLTNRIEIRSKKEGTKVFQFELNESSKTVEGLADYLKRFYFFALQTNTTGAQSLINTTFREKCRIIDATYSSSLSSLWKRGGLVTLSCLNTTW
jgi:hypothetical protein